MAGFVLFEEDGRFFLRRGLVCELGQVYTLWRGGKGSGGCGRPEVVGRRGIKKNRLCGGASDFFCGVLFGEHGGDGFGDGLELPGMALDFVDVAGFEARLDVGDGFGGGGFVVYDLLGDAFEVDEHLHDVLGDEGQVFEDGEEDVEDLVGGAGVFDGEGVEGADGGGEFEGDFLDGVDHGFVFFDDVGDVLDGVCELV